MPELIVDIADSPMSLAQGLMFVKNLPTNQGMLFKFSSMTEARFWGKNTYIPLDLAFIADDRITDIRSITPMSTKIISASSPCSMAVEANAGYFNQHGISKGHRVKIREQEDGKFIVSFNA